MKRILRQRREIIAYVFWGALTTLANWCAYTLLLMLGADILVSGFFAWMIEVLFAYFTNKIRVFRNKNWQGSAVLHEMLSFFSSRAATGAVEIIGVPVLMTLGLRYTLFGIDGGAAKLVVTLAVVALNYVFSKLVVFRKKSG